MEITQNLQAAQTLRHLVEQEQDEVADGVDLQLLTLLDTYIRDEQYRLGLISSPYSDDLQRRIFLKQILQTADSILDKMSVHFDGQSLPPAAIGLCRFLFEVTYPTFLVIQAIETEHPQHAESFAADRSSYAASRGAV